MNKISVLQISVFVCLFSTIVSLSIFTTIALLSPIDLGDYRGVVSFLSTILFLYSYAFLVYRIFIKFFPINEGTIEENTPEELAAQVSILFYLILFNSLIRTHFIPTPLMRLVYLALGARLGSNTYSVGAILDPPLTTIGDNCIIGHNAVLFCHAIEGQKLAFSPIKIGNNVTIGAMAVIMPGAHIENGAIVSAGSVVTKHTHIGKNEIWGGVPAKKIR